MAYTAFEKENGIAIIWLDQPGEKINKLAVDLVDEFDKLIDQLNEDSDIKAAVLISRKPDNFIAGADLEKLRDLTEPGQVEALSRSAHRIMNRIASSRKPIVAAINGAALGGGLEVALACHYRIASDSPKTILGLPEVKLGLLPAAGGTQRLPRLVGLQKALDIMLTGKNIYPYSARKMGLVDHVIHPHGLLDAARKAARNLVNKKPDRDRKDGIAARLLDSTSLTRKVIYKKARDMTEKQTLGNYPAPLKIIDCVETGMEKGMEAGLIAEAREFEVLARTPQAGELIQLFFGMNALKKNPLKEKARPVKQVAVLGAGFMGAGIAGITALKDIDVLLKDINLEALGGGKKTIYRDYSRRVKRKAMSRFERDRVFGRITGVVDYRLFDGADIVIEAVFEDLDLKRKILAETEAAVPAEAVFASNTSALPISDIAANAKHPERVLGMHYFSPVPKMPLLEIIVTKKTAEWATATATELGVLQGKTVIVVKDGPGFYTTRILAPMLNEALLLLEDGGDIAHIDRTMKRFGFPVGPFTLIDEVGIDVGSHVSEILGKLFAKRAATVSDAMSRLNDAGYRGRKNKKGFYQYDEKTGFLSHLGKSGKEVNTTIYSFFGGPGRRKHSETEIQNRLTMMMVNEALLSLEEGILTSPRDGDLGAVLGLGFPPFLGGPFRYIDRLSAATVHGLLEDLATRHGKRFVPAGILKDHAEKGKGFYRDV